MVFSVSFLSDLPCNCFDILTVFEHFGFHYMMKNPDKEELPLKWFIINSIV